MSDERKQWAIGIIGVAVLTSLGLQTATSIYEFFQKEQAVEAQVVKNLDELKRQLAEAREEIRDTHAGVDANAEVTWEQIDEAWKRPKIKKPIIQGSFESTHIHPGPPNADALFPIPDSVNRLKFMGDHAEKDTTVPAYRPISLTGYVISIPNYGVVWIGDHAHQETVICSNFSGTEQWRGDDDSPLDVCHFAQHLPSK